MNAHAVASPVDTISDPEHSLNGSSEEAARTLSARVTSRRGKTYEQIERAFTQYLAGVKQLGIVSSLLVGAKGSGPGAYLWNVFTEDFAPEQWAAPAFAELNALTFQLEQGLPKNRSLYIAHVNPSDVAEVRARCTEQDIDTVLLPVR